MEQCAAKLCSPKKQQAQRNGLTKGKSKRQMSLETDADAVKAPAKASTAKAPQKGTPQKGKADTNRNLSSKEKV